MTFRFCLALGLALGAARSSSASALPPRPADVVKATLRNGLRVVIVRNVLAPVVSTDLAYLAGSRDDPPDAPGMAHAAEHMMFRGTASLSTSELGTLATALGGNFNAETSDTITQFQFTVPATDLDAILRVEADRMRGVLDAQEQWQNERGAIEQEVLRDQSSPGGEFFRQAQALAFAGTPYGHEGVGTLAAFDRLTGPEIKTFHARWYAPNNAVLVIAGDVEAKATLALVRSRFESIPRRAVPAHATAHLAPLPRTEVRRPTPLIYPLAVVGYRMPGLDNPDFLASFVLQGLLASARGPLHALADSGETLDGEFISMPYVAEAQLGFATAALGPGGDPSAMTARIEEILGRYARSGVPRELFDSTKRRLIADQEESRNSISALASDWATTIALDNEPSISKEQDLIAAVTLADVDRVAKRYFDPRHAIVGALTPSANASQSAAPAPAQQGPEKPLNAQPAVTHLPEWANHFVRDISIPDSKVAPQQSKLSNGITLIVVPESISDSVFLYGAIETEPALQEPAGKEGVSSVLGALFEAGTQAQDRSSFARSLDDIDTQISAGSSFGMQTTPRSFPRAVEMLAANELTPRLAAPDFELARRRTADELATALNGVNAVATHRAARLLYPAGDPELREPTVSGVRDLSLDDVKSYYAKTMRPDLTTIVVVGNVTPAAARAAVERAFGGWHASGERPNLDFPAIPRNGPGEVKLALPSASQDIVSLRQIVPLGSAAPESYPLQLGNAILGGGALGPEQSRLFRDLRQDAGLVYSIGSTLSLQRARSQFTIEFASSPANEARISALIVTEIQRMKSEPVGDFELALMKASIVRRTIVSGSSVGAIGSSLIFDASEGLPLDQAQIDARRFIAVDAHAVQAAFATFIHPEDFVRVIEGP